MREKIGCLHRWDASSDVKLPLCTKIQDLLEYRNLSLHLSLLDIEDIVSETGCQVPCKYTKYSITSSVPEVYPQPK